MPTRPKEALLALPVSTWKTDGWGESVEAPVEGSRKEQLLRQSLDLVRGENGNESAVREVIEKALESRLYQLAFEAMQAFGPDSAFDLCVCVTDIFEIKYWRFIPSALPISLSEYCEKRVLATTECRSGFGFGDHFTDQRSRALGYLGRYRFFKGNIPRALELWDAADDPIDVDEIIGEMCELIAEHSSKKFDYALSLANYIVTKNTKAKVLARLSQYVE
jgi:hypothetical protein